MADDDDCLHCAISMLLVEREAKGEPVSHQAVWNIFEVLGDILNSTNGEQRKELADFMMRTIARVLVDVHTGRWEHGRTAPDLVPSTARQ